MQQIKNLWSRMDLTNRIILFTGIALAVALLVTRQGAAAVTTIVLMGFFMINHANQRRKALHRLYGTMYFHMPDGEIVPRMFELVRAEFQQGGAGRYNGRPVTLRFRYWRQDEEHRLDTGFGLMVETEGCEAAKELLSALRKGDYVSVTGEISVKSREYFTIASLTDIHRIREEEILSLMPEDSEGI